MIFQSYGSYNCLYIRERERVCGVCVCVCVCSSLWVSVVSVVVRSECRRSNAIILLIFISHQKSQITFIAKCLFSRCCVARTNVFLSALHAGVQTAARHFLNTHVRSESHRMLWRILTHPCSHTHTHTHTHWEHLHIHRAVWGENSFIVN